MSTKPGAVIDLVEACYRDEPDEGRWLGAIADAAGPLLADGLGTKVSIYRMHDGQVATTNAACGARAHETRRSLTSSVCRCRPCACSCTGAR